MMTEDEFISEEEYEEVKKIIKGKQNAQQKAALKANLFCVNLSQMLEARNEFIKARRAVREKKEISLT